MKIDYLEIIKKAWKITWDNKYLWWFGLFLALGGGGGFSFNFPGGNNWDKQFEKKSESINNFFSQHFEIIACIIIVIVLLGITLFVFRILSQAGILKSLEKIEKKEISNFKSGLLKGKKYFWKLLTIILVLSFFVICLAIALFVPVGFLFYLKSFVSAIFAAFLAVSIFISLIILTSFIGKYASFYVVLSDLGITDSLENGYRLFRKNIIASIIMALLFIPISMVLTVAAIMLVLFVGLVFLMIGLALYLFFSKIGIVIAVISGLIVFLTVLILLSSVYQVFYQTTWFLFFKEIASVKKEEREKEEVSEKIVEKSLPSPERA